MLPPAQTSNAAPPPSWAQQPPAVQAPPQPVYPVAPPPPPVSAPTRTQDEIDREQAMLNEMLRHAADELSGEMHAQDPDAKPSSEGQDPYKSAEDDGTSSTR
jgi:hypothetical protein